MHESISTNIDPSDNDVRIEEWPRLPIKIQAQVRAKILGNNNLNTELTKCTLDASKYECIHQNLEPRSTSEAFHTIGRNAWASSFLLSSRKPRASLLHKRLPKSCLLKMQNFVIQIVTGNVQVVMKGRYVADCRRFIIWKRRLILQVKLVSPKPMYPKLIRVVGEHSHSLRDNNLGLKYHGQTFVSP